MTLVQWAPIRDLSILQRQMDRLFEGHTNTEEYAARDFTPAAEIVTTDKNILVNFEIPGLDPATIDLQVAAQQITISGNRPAVAVEEATGHRSELAYGTFYRRINLPEKVQNDKVEARYDQGILRLVLPKLVEDRNKVVKVEITQ
jgi:HSP20 family protein